MNGAYGGLGARQGGVFNDASALAAAVTACGRRLITGVSKTVESVVWLDPDHDTGGIDGIDEQPATGVKRPVTVYGGDYECILIDTSHRSTHIISYAQIPIASSY